MPLSRAGSVAQKGSQQLVRGAPRGHDGRGGSRAEPPARPCPWAAAAAPMGAEFPPKLLFSYRLPYGWAGCAPSRGVNTALGPLSLLHTPIYPHTCAGKQLAHRVQVLSGRGRLSFQIRKLSQMNDKLRFCQAMVLDHIFVVLSSPRRAPEAQSRNRISNSLILHKETLHL